MQKHQVAGEAGPRAPSWYLARGDKRYGPLADRELLLLAERGGLRTDDLLWKPGFSSWKPVHAVCDLKTSPEVTSRKIASTQKASPPVVPAQDASYLPDGLSGDAPRHEDVVGALDVSEPRKPGLKAKLYDELRRFLMIFAYLWIVFFVFLVHEWIVLADNHIGFRFYGLAVINALVLSKIMLIAEGLRFGERFDDKPLIIPILYKSVLFSVLLVVAYILEEIGLGWFHGKSVAESLPQIGGGGVVGTLCVTALLCIALVPFFAFREIARAIGETEFRSLMLARAGRQDHSRYQCLRNRGRYVRLVKGKTFEPLSGKVRAALERNISARAASIQVSLVASAQNTNGLAASRKWTRGSTEDTDCKVIKISSRSLCGE